MNLIRKKRFEEKFYEVSCERLRLISIVIDVAEWLWSRTIAFCVFLCNCYDLFTDYFVIIFCDDYKKNRCTITIILKKSVSDND